MGRDPGGLTGTQEVQSSADSCLPPPLRDRTFLVLAICMNVLVFENCSEGFLVILGFFLLQIPVVWTFRDKSLVSQLY